MPLIFSFDHPELLWLLLLAGPVVYLGQRSLATLDGVRRWTAIGMRLAVLGLLVLMLAGMQAVQRHTDLTVIAVVDQSESIRRFARPPQPEPNSAGNTSADSLPDSEARNIELWIRDWFTRSGDDKKTDDRFGMVTYDDRPTVRAMPGQRVQLDPGTIGQPIDGTNTAAGLRAAMALPPSDSAARIILVSDGNDTDGQIIEAAYEAKAAGIPIDVLPIEYQVKNEVMVDRLYAPAEAREGQTVGLRVVLRATAPTGGLLYLLHDDAPVDLNGDQPGTAATIAASAWRLGTHDQSSQSDLLEADQVPDEDDPAQFMLVRQIDLPLKFTGANKFEAVFEPDAGQDAMSANNHAQAFTLVAGKGRILFVDNLGGGSGAILPKTLASHGVQLDVVAPHAMPTSITQLQRYDAVIFQNVPADLITGPQQKMLVKYVHDMGGGFVMVGGPESFGAGAWTNSPIDKYILPVSCQIPSQTILPSGALVFVIDRSGSMASSVAGSNMSQMEVAGEAAILALQTLYPQDLVGVVAFDHTAKLIVDVQTNNNPAAIAQKIRSIHAGGGTDIYPGLEMAYRRLAPVRTDEAAIKHIILLTDGQSNSGNYIKIVGLMMQANITLSTVGVGDGHDAALLSKLAQMGGGQYHPVSNPSNLPQIFIKEAKTIRKNLIKEVPFVPVLQSTGSPIMANVASVPELKGLVLTGEKHDPRILMPMLGPEGEPLFAHWQVGLGRSAAFTSDATNRWATQWMQWGGYGDFWARTVRTIARPSRSRDVDMVTAIQNNRLTVRIDAASVDAASSSRIQANSFGNFLNIQGSVLRPDGSTESITLNQIGPGLYEADVPAHAAGNYVVSLFMQDRQGNRRGVYGGVSRPPGKELRHFSSNTALLKEVQQITGGRWLDPAAVEPAGLFERTIAFESRSIRPLWRTLLWWLVAAVLLDVANRRIAWELGAILAWVRGRFSALAGALQPRRVDAEATLSALKQRRRRVVEAAETLPSAPPMPPPSRTQKFQAPADAVAQEDFTAAVGGATDRPLATAVGAAVAGDSEAQDEQPQTTSRLLDAKRRAQQRLDDK